MKRTITFGAAVLAALSLNSVANAQEVTFKKATPAVGETNTTTEERKMTNKISVIANGQVLQRVEQKVKETVASKVTVLALDGKKITKIKVTYKKKETKEDLGQGPKSNNSKLVGKTFLVSKSGDALTVTDEAGKKVDDAVAKEVEADHGKRLGEFDNNFADVLPDRAIKVGETITVDKKKANSFFKNKEEKDPMEVSSFTLKLTGTKKINGVMVGVFDMHVKLAAEPGPNMKVTVVMKGTAHVGVDNCYPHLMDLKGPLAMNGKNQGMEMKGAGEMHMKIHAVYGQAGATSKPTTGGK